MHHDFLARIAHAINSVETLWNSAKYLMAGARIAHAINSVETSDEVCHNDLLRRVLRMLLIALKPECQTLRQSKARIAHAINSVETYRCFHACSGISAYCACY